MLKVKTAVSLDSLADELIKDLKDSWKNPLDAPVVIFADNKIEQWFKLKWLTKESALANLNTKRLDRFLLEVFSVGDKTKEILSTEALRNVIISYLIQKGPKDKCNYELLNDGVKCYLEDDGVLNESRFFDFAEKMAELFKKYETSRPSEFEKSKEENTFIKGIIEAWNGEQDNSFFKKENGSSVENEDWQFLLYKSLFLNSDSVMGLVNSRIGRYQKKSVSYYTLPQIYESMKDSSTNKINLKYKSKYPVFIFGLSGVGQFYRVVFKNLAESNDIVLFIQSLTKAKLANDENIINNELLKNWGKTGIENLLLYKEKDNILQIEEKSITSDCGSLLSCLKNSIIDNKESINSNIKEKNPSLEITACPSKIREIENLYSNICRLLNGSLTGGKHGKFNEILVIAPNIEDYKTEILEVFAQSQTKSEEERGGKEKSVLYIPFRFVDAFACDSLTAQALHTLFSIHNKNSLSRVDFFSLVRNPVVQLVRNINNEEIKEWETWITDMNIYRDRNCSDNICAGWLDAVKRLLLARLCNEVVFDGDKEYVPYANIASGDNESLCRFIECVESLEYWIDKNKWLKKWNTSLITNESLDSIMDFISSWLFIKEPPKELTNEAIVFESIKSARENLKFYYSAGNEFLSWHTAHFALLSTVQNADYNSGSLFTDGITFMKFAPNRSIPVKYLFMLGADADALPGRSTSDNLDLRNLCPPWKGDSTFPEKNRLAFISQLLNTSEKFFISYVNKDLQKDEDFYPSSLIADIKNFLKKSDCIKYLNENEITLDETRNWDCLFTKREIRNKTNQNNFDGTARNFQKEFNGKESVKPPTIVRFYNIKQFLLDPFEFQVNRILGIDEMEEDSEKTEFEPITAKTVAIQQLERMRLALKLGIQLGNKINTVDELKNKAIERGLIPDGVFGEKAWAESGKNIEQYVENIKILCPDDDYSFYKKKLVSDIDNESLKVSWKLTGEFLIVAESNREIHFIKICRSKADKTKNYLDGYISALALLCSEKELNKAIYIDTIDGKLQHGQRVVETNGNDALNILNTIYEKAFKEQFAKVIPFDYLEEKNLTYSKYIKSFKSDAVTNPWRFFSVANLFEIEKVCGFNEDDFSEVWPLEAERQKKLIPDLWYKKGND